MSDKKSDSYVVRMPDVPTSRSNIEAATHYGRTASSSSLLKLDNSPGASILAYCLSSISMTLINKYVVSGNSWNLHFFYLAVQV